MKPDETYNQLSTELKSIEDQIREIKQKQFTGTDTVQTYSNQAPGDWDIDWTPVWFDPMVDALIRGQSVVFTSDNQDAPVNNMRYKILIDDSIVYTINSADDHPQDCAVTGYFHDVFLTYAGLAPSPKKDAWLFTINAYRSGMNIKIKFIVDSTDTGQVSWREV
jgi:hypothetical protein